MASQLCTSSALGRSAPRIQHTSSQVITAAASLPPKEGRHAPFPHGSTTTLRPQNLSTSRHFHHPSVRPPKHVERGTHALNDLMTEATQDLKDARHNNDHAGVRRHEHAIQYIWLLIEDHEREAHKYPGIAALMPLRGRSAIMRDTKITEGYTRRAESPTRVWIEGWSAEVGMLKHNVLVDGG